MFSDSYFILSSVWTLVHLNTTSYSSDSRESIVFSQIIFITINYHLIIFPAMTLAGKLYFDAMSKIGENAAVSPVSRELGKFPHVCPLLMGEICTAVTY